MVDRTLVLTQRGTLQPPADWRLVAGRFTDPSRDDVVAYHPSNGSLWLARNTGAPFQFARWSTVQPADRWWFGAGDFTLSVGADLVGYHPSNGTVWVGRNTGGGVAFETWATVSPADDWRFVPGFFTGGARQDLVGYHPSNGTVWVGANGSGSFSFSEWATVTSASGWQFVAGRFTGSGRDDLVGYHPANGSLWLGRNTGASFVFEKVGDVEPWSGWEFVAGTFTGGPLPDLVGYHRDSGTLWLGVFDGGRFGFEYWSMVTPGAGWQWSAASFHGQSHADLLGYHPINGSVWVGSSMPRSIEGYCWPLSAAPGESVGFALSGRGQASVEFARHSSLDASIDRVVVGHATVALASQLIPPDAPASGCGWTNTLDVTVPATWSSGIYAARCTDGVGASTDITFVVKPAAGSANRIAVLANVNTWLAYNDWGGASKYGGAARSSFLRPNPVATPDRSMHLTRGELWVLGWLAREGYGRDVFTDIDFHRVGLDAAVHRCLIVGTHPEYWSHEMLDRLDAYLNAGGSLAYLGGNGLFELASYETGETGMLFRLGVEGGPRSPAMFRALSPARHERSILGVATERCGVVGSPYVVVAPQHAMLAGTGLRAGDRIGAFGYNTEAGNGQASGWEVDTVDGPGAVGVPDACAMEPVPVPPSSLPPGLVVLARGEADAGGRGADMTCFDHPGGGVVFSVGSLTFGGSLVADPALSRIVRNVLTRAGV